MKMAKFFKVANTILDDVAIAEKFIKYQLPKPNKGEKFVNFNISFFPYSADNFIKNVTTCRILYDRYKAPRIAFKKYR